MDIGYNGSGATMGYMGDKEIFKKKGDAMRDHFKENRDFITALMGNETLQIAIEWIRDNLSPENVFRQEDLEIWAENNNYIDVSREKE